MAEIAGLVLGGIPLIVLALNNYEPLETFQRYRISIETFRADLTLQSRQFQRTLSNVGLGKDASIEELRECFETKFTDVSHELMIVVERMNQLVAKLMRDLDVNFDTKSQTLQDKTKWEWRKIKHSLSTKRRNKVIDDLRNWNEDLRRSLENYDIPAEDHTRKVQDLKLKFNTRRCDSIRQHFKSLHRAIGFGLNCSCSPSHQAAIDLNWETFSSKETNYCNLAVSYESASQPESLTSWQKIRVMPEVSRSDAQIVSGSLITPLVRAKALFPENFVQSKGVGFRPVHSNSRTCPPLPSTSNQNPTSPKSCDKITCLCTTMRTIRNSQNTTRFHGILENPNGDKDHLFSLDCMHVSSSAIVRVVPLRHVLSCQACPVQQDKGWLLLSAKHRYGIAASIAWSVLHMSDSPWFGEHWDYARINLFLEKDEGGRYVLSQYPYTLSSFSPPVLPAVTLEDPVTDDLKQFIPNTAIFMLGILLIELCLQKPLADSKSANGRTTPVPLSDVYQQALSNLDGVYRAVGDSYGDATMRCIKFSFSGWDMHNNFDFADFRQQFYEAVVAPVQATYDTFAKLQSNKTRS